MQRSAVWQKTNYKDYVDEDGNFDGTSYLLALLAWKMRNGAFLQHCLHDQKRYEQQKRITKSTARRSNTAAATGYQTRIISLNECVILCVPKALNWYSQYVHMP